MKSHGVTTVALSMDGKREVYVSVEIRQTTSRGNGFVEGGALDIGARFAKCLGLVDGERVRFGARHSYAYERVTLILLLQVHISVVDSTPSACSKAFCEVSPDDWPIVVSSCTGDVCILASFPVSLCQEKNSKALEDCLLDQITAVTQGMVVPVWLKSNVIEITIGMTHVILLSIWQLY